MATAEIPQLHGPAATSAVAVEANVRSGGSITISSSRPASSGVFVSIVGLRASPVRSMNVTQPSWPQMVAGRNTRVAEGVVEVPVGVDDDRDRVGGQRAQVGQDLARLAVRRARIDDQGLTAAQDHADVLVVELVAAHEHAVRDLDPAIGDAHRRMISSRTRADRPVLGSPDNRTPPPGSASER